VVQLVLLILPVFRSLPARLPVTLLIKVEVAVVPSFFHVPFNSAPISEIITITSCTFSNNIASALGGGAIVIFASQPAPGTSASITSCTFTGNVAGFGGAIYIDSLPAYITSCTFNNNAAWATGGAVLGACYSNAIFNLTQIPQRPQLQITSSTFIQNNIVGIPSFLPFPLVFPLSALATAFSTSFGFPTASVSVIATGGGAISSQFGGNLLVQTCQFVSNNAGTGGTGGAILVGGGEGNSGGLAFGMNNAYLQLTGSVASGNTPNNDATLDPAGLGAVLNGVEYVSDGSVV